MYPEAYEIYSLIIVQQRAGSNSSQFLYISDQTSQGRAAVFQSCLHEQYFSDPERAAEKDFEQNSSKHWKLEARFNIPAKYELLSEDQSNALSQGIPKTDPGAFWTKLRQLHRGFEGIATFSAVGFNANKTVAVAYVEWTCGSLCGRGTKFVLKRQNKKWHIVQNSTRGCWIS